MTLVDTSIWVSHLRNKNHELAYLLTEGKVYCHPYIIGEIACGHLKNRREILAHLHALLPAKVLEQEEVLQFIETRRLFGSGIGWIDAHLLASALLSRVSLWTNDSNLLKAARHLSIAY